MRLQATIFSRATALTQPARTYARLAPLLSAQTLRPRPFHSAAVMSSAAVPAPVSSAAAAAAAAAPVSSSASADFWNPKQYLLYDAFRARPGVDLIDRAISLFKLTHPGRDVSSVRRIVDLGCGTGKLALQLAGVFTHAKVEGVDSSNNMLEKAREAASKSSDSTVKDRVSWRQASFEQFTDAAGLDILFSNAALHWSHQHETLFPHLMHQVAKPGGILAVQIPNNFRAPSHTNMLRALHACGSFSKERIEQIWSNQPNTHIDGASHYYHLLSADSSLLDCWETEYVQNISSDTKYHPVLEWTKSTALAPILDAFPNAEERDRFQQLYSDLLEKDYPYFESKMTPGKREVLFPFKRVFIIAVRK